MVCVTLFVHLYSETVLHLLLLKPMYENILYEISDGIARITLNRPKVYNALSPGLLKDITAAVQAAHADDSVRVVVLTGAGEKAFCSGADLKEGMGEASGLGESLRQNYNPMILAIRTIPKPVICRLNGVAAGAGCCTACCVGGRQCRRRWAEPRCPLAARGAGACRCVRACPLACRARTGPACAAARPRGALALA